MLKINFLFIMISIFVLSSVSCHVKADIGVVAEFDMSQHIIRKLKNDIQKIKSQQVQNDLCTLAVGGSWGYIISLFMQAYKFKDNKLANVAAGLTGVHAIITFLIACKLICSSECLKKELSFLNNELELALASQQLIDEQEKLQVI